MLTRRDQRGASLLETVLIMPALLLALMLIVQAGLYLHARNIAEQAAEEGAADARAFDGTEAEARERTKDYLEALDQRTLQNRSVAVNRGAESATVTVRGTVLSLIPIPGLDFTVEETASGPVERYVPPAGD